MQNSLFEQRLENLKTVLDSNSQAVLLTNEKNIGYILRILSQRRLFTCD